MVKRLLEPKFWTRLFAAMMRRRLLKNSLDSMKAEGQAHAAGHKQNLKHQQTTREATGA
jgi:hypothetical protein